MSNAGPKRVATSSAVSRRPARPRAGAASASPPVPPPPAPPPPPVPGGEAGEAALVARDPGTRQLTDPQTMRALAHPTRLALLEALAREGPLTATQAANLLDDSPGNISWHLQNLAKYGYIEETGTGRGRSRPWRLVSLGQRFDSGTSSSAGSEAAADALATMVVEQSYERLREWRAARATFDEAWRYASFTTHVLTYLTPAELDELAEEISTVLHRFAERTLDRSRRPPGSAPVQLVAWGHPITPNPSGS
ncbi:MAG TPA: helix-turn-helix domain-containing protein [Acidimicrobiales bacterium]|nr:helix-turn-helix domain-containing protein [Acidimicrobiales bacterium]